MGLRDPAEQRMAAAQRNAIRGAAAEATGSIAGLLTLTGLLVAKGMLSQDDALAVVSQVTTHLQPGRAAEVRAAAAATIPGLFDDE